MLRRNKRKRKKKNPIYEIDLYLRPLEKTNELIKRIEDMQEDIKVIRKLKEIERESKKL